MRPSPDVNRRASRTSTIEIVAAGYGYPSVRVDNASFFARCQGRITADRDRLIAETQMSSRLWCSEDENTLTLARVAVARALETSPRLRDEIDVVIATSSTTMPVLHPPDAANPGMGELAPLILRDLGRVDGVGLDLKGVYCTGFVRALEVMDGLLENPDYRAGLIVCAEQGSRFAVEATNRSSFSFLAGDAAGAVVVRRAPRRAQHGLVDVVGHLDPSKLEWVGVGADGRSMVNQGAKVGEAVSALFVECGKRLLKRNGLNPDEVDWILPLQTHARIVEHTRQALGFTRGQMLWFGDRTGLAGSASIPACFAEQRERGLVRPGDLVLAVAVAAGLNCAGALFYA